MTMIELIAALNAAGARVAAGGGRLQLSGGNAGDDLRQAVADHEAELLALLSPPAPAASPDAEAFDRHDHGWLDWRLEWLTELGALYLMMRSCRDEHVLGRLRPLAEATPAGRVEWLTLYRQIADTEHELRQAGKLPSYPWPSLEMG